MLRICYSHFMGGANVTCNCMYCLTGYVTDSHRKSTTSYHMHLGTKLCGKSLNGAVTIMVYQGHHTTRNVTKTRILYCDSRVKTITEYVRAANETCFSHNPGCRGTSSCCLRISLCISMHCEFLYMQAVHVYLLLNLQT